MAPADLKSDKLFLEPRKASLNGGSHGTNYAIDDCIDCFLLRSSSANKICVRIVRIRDNNFPVEEPLKETMVGEDELIGVVCVQRRQRCPANEVVCWRDTN